MVQSWYNDLMASDEDAASSSRRGGRFADLGEIVRTLREAKGWTRAQLAAKTAAMSHPVGEVMIAKIEQGARAPSTKTLTSLAAAFGVPPEELAARATAWELAKASLAPKAALGAIAMGQGVGAVAGATSAGALGAGALAGLGMALGPISAAGLIGARAVSARNSLRRQQLVGLLERLEHADPAVQDEIAQRFGMSLVDVIPTPDELNEGSDLESLPPT